MANEQDNNNVINAPKLPKTKARKTTRRKKPAQKVVVELKDKLQKSKQNGAKRRRPKVILGAITIIVASIILGSYMSEDGLEGLENNMRSVVSHTQAAADKIKINLVGEDAEDTIEPKFIEQMDVVKDSLDDQNKLLAKALEDFTKNRALGRQRLEEVANSMLGLAEHIKFIQQQIQNMQETMARITARSAADRNYMLLGQAIDSVYNGYHSGQVSMQQLENLNIFVNQIVVDKTIAEQVKALIEVTPEGKAVTLAEILVLIEQLKLQGIPSQADLKLKDAVEESEDQDSLGSKAKNALISWISVKKSEKSAQDFNHPWSRELDKLQILLVREDLASALQLVKTSQHLSTDGRLQDIKLAIELYQSQQQAMYRLNQTYNKKMMLISSPNIAMVPAEKPAEEPANKSPAK